MVDKNDTPTGLEPSYDGVNEWVRYQLVKILNRLGAIEKKVDTNCKKLDRYDEKWVTTEVRLAEGVQQFISLNKQIEQLQNMKKSNPNGNNGPITFKWLVEELGTPVITSVVTAIIVAALVYWVTQGA